MAYNDYVNVVATQGFQQAAHIYEQSRPTYPSEVIQFIKTLSPQPNIIVDLGAGTGKLTRLLGPIGAREIIAVEPVPSMREYLNGLSLISKIVDGAAECMPFGDSTVDVILCGQAFHWFANCHALNEINRVLKPNGLLILVWNRADNRSREWAENILNYVDTFRSDEIPCYRKMEWKHIFDNQTLFSSLQHKQFSHSQSITQDLMVNRILSISFIARLSVERKKQLAENIRKVLDDVEEIKDLKTFDMNYFTDVYWCSALKPCFLSN